jgi:hypothetical protein
MSFAPLCVNNKRLQSQSKRSRNVFCPSKMTARCSVDTRLAVAYFFAKDNDLAVPIREWVDVRLQSAPCSVPTRKGRRQTRNDAVQQLDYARLCRRGRTKRGGCLLPGTEVAFEKEIEFERGFGLFSSWKREKTIGDKVARFRQVNTDKPNVHHDALEFPNGEIALVTRLYEGQHATVLQLPASPHSVNGAEQVRYAVVLG